MTGDQIGVLLTAVAFLTIGAYGWRDTRDSMSGAALGIGLVAAVAFAVLLFQA